jgi:hypothetical protein
MTVIGKKRVSDLLSEFMDFMLVLQALRVVGGKGQGAREQGASGG